MTDMSNVTVPEQYPAARPSKLVPVLIGGVAMALISNIPLLNLVNLLCCAGIMGGAVLGVFFYQRSFPAGLAFTVRDGVVIGVLAGLVGALLNLAVFAMEILAASDLSVSFQIALNEIEQQFEDAGQSAEFMDTLDQVRRILMDMAAHPWSLVAVMGVVSGIQYTLFGLLGGLIGGNIFKTKNVQVDS